MRINFGDLIIGDTAKHYVQKALCSNWITEGENVKQFEKNLSSLFDCKHVIATSSGTDADIVACSVLYDYGAKRGDEILVPALSFVATSNAVLAAGFIPKFVDVELETLNINPDKIEGAITGKTKAIMVVHTMGKPCEMDKIMAIAHKHKLLVIEDACEAHGAIYKNKLVGTIGDIGIFSFYVAHQIVCGEGGAIITNNDKIAETVHSIKSHGRPPHSIYFDFQRVGYNSKMNDLTAAIGLESIEQFKTNFVKRKENLYYLLDILKCMGLEEHYHFIKEEEFEVVSPHAFPIVLKNNEKGKRDNLYQYLESHEIQCKTLFGSLPTQHDAFKFLGYKLGDFPVAEYIGNNGLHFGMHQYLSEQDMKHIAGTLFSYTAW